MFSPDLAPEGTVWVCLACGAHDRSKDKLWERGCCVNIALCHLDKPPSVSKHGWRLYEPRG